MTTRDAFSEDAPLLELIGVEKRFGGGFLSRVAAPPAVTDFSLTLPGDPPRLVTIAGESGSGKTTVARLVLGLLTASAGEILYRGVDVSRLGGRLMRSYRREVQAIFQDPYDVYNPFYTINHVFDMLVGRFKLARSRAEARELVVNALETVGLDPGRVLGRYPHQLSGGQRQRIMVARALLLRPRLIVADEPVSMVDASLRASILEAMLRLKEEYRISFLYITHDLSTAYQVSDEIVILYRGRIVERGATRTVIDAPRHAYTRLLVNSIPVPDPDVRWEGRLKPSDLEQLDATVVDAEPQGVAG